MSQKIKNFCSQLHHKLALLLVVCSLCGCQTQAQPEQVLRIGVALYAQDDTFISSIVQHLEQIARETELEMEDWKVNISIVDGHRNQTTQIDQIDQFLKRGYDMLCVNVVDRTAAAVLIDKAEAADVPMIFFNRQPVAEDIERWEHSYYVGSRAEEGGTLQGELVLQGWKEDTQKWDKNQDGVMQYVMLEGEPGHQDTLLRTEYALKPFAAEGIATEKLASDTANWNRAQATAKVNQWISQFGDQIEVVFSNNDDMALGAVDAFTQAQMEFPMIVGVDAIESSYQAIADGTLYGTVKNDARGIAQAMMDLILCLERGNPPSSAVDLQDGHYIWLPYEIVTQ